MFGGYFKKDDRHEFKPIMAELGRIEKERGLRRRMPIGSGMTVTAEIKVEHRRIIEFFIYPIIKYLDEGLKVR